MQGWGAGGDRFPQGEQGTVGRRGLRTELLEGTPVWTLDSEQAEEGRTELGSPVGLGAAELSGTPALPPSSHALLSPSCGGCRDNQDLSERLREDRWGTLCSAGVRFPLGLLLQEKQAMAEQCGGGSLNKGPRALSPHGRRIGRGIGQAWVRGALDPKAGWQHPQWWVPGLGR